MDFQKKTCSVLRKILFRSFLITLFSLTSILGQSGCSLINRQIPSHAWSEAFVYNTVHYTVNTNTSPETARDIGELMENAVKEYRELTGYRDEYLPVFMINVYATRKEYEAVARKQGLPADITTGLYSPVPPAAIHLPYIRERGRHPAGTLLHEGVHQFLDRVMSFSVEPDVRNNLSPSKQRLLGVPLWLNEGLATYMESSFVNEDRLEVGRINSDRLIYLQKLIRTGKVPPVREVLSRRYGEPFSSGDYAAAWGIVYALQHFPQVAGTDGKKQLRQYLEACRKAFYEKPSVEFQRDFLPDNKPLDDFEKQWYLYISRQSPVFFERIIVGQGSTIEAWEQDWINYIRRLTP